jgi:tetratricopeptide (TPR) repeat protein
MGGEEQPNSLLLAARAHAAANRWQEAEAIFVRVTRAAPEQAGAWYGLGYVAYQVKRYGDAERSLRRAVELRPNDPVFRGTFAATLAALKKHPEAIREYEAALKFGPEQAGLLSNFGNTLCATGDFDRAIALLSRAIELEPNSSLFRRNLIQCLLTAKKAPEAIEQIEKLRILAPGPAVEMDYGSALVMLGRHEEAIAAYRRAEAAGHRDYNMFHNLATVLQDLGHIEEAEEAYRNALVLKPDFAPSRRQLASNRKYDVFDRDAQELEDLLKKPDLLPVDRAELHMGLAKILDDLGMYPKAFSHLQTGNQIIRSRIDYNADRNSDYVDALIETFNEDFFAQRSSFGLQSELPIFVLGMPRSGTTLVEQILCSHPEVHGAGELKKLYDLYTGLGQRLKSDIGMARVARVMDKKTAYDVAQEYLNYLISFNANTRYVIDKMPFNYRAIGLIALLFPKARILHCVRDPRDVALSCYFARFNDNLSFSFNLGEIGRYYRDYDRLMTHWRRVIRNPILDVHYETLVTSQEASTRRMLEFCDLQWDEQCLQFHETERTVLTASNWQVRQPMYTSSIGRWQNYRDYLEPLMAALAIGPDECAAFAPPQSTKSEEESVLVRA